MADLTKVKLGPCKVTFDPEGTTPIVIELTQGGVVLTYSETTRDVNADQYGSTPIKRIITGRSATVEVPALEKDNARLQQVIAGAVTVTNSSTPTKKRVDVFADKVIDLFTVAKEVRIEPLAEGSTPDDTVTLFNAAPQVNLNYRYNFESELVTNITFAAFPDATGRLIGFGDPDA
ncbi:hypothetical protein ACFSR7_36245 [Cohnella sp. GCM10020058]|uniref:hypothetical protein n=1 Tax=Cohnella sp. GCM10020058 TaxID=3317330 RepID=UPI003637694A